jgi:hypothetical protein
MIGVAVTAVMVSAMVLPSGAAMAFALGAGLHPAVGCPDADYRSTTTASLLSLLDAGASGARELAAAAESEFVQDYREMEARLSAAGASATEQPMPPEFTESKRAFRRAIVAFRPPPFQRAVRAAPAASRLQLAPPVGLLTGIREGVQNFPVFLDEPDPCQIRPCRHRDVLPGGLTPQHLPQQLMQPPIMPLAEQALPLRVLADRQLRAAAATADRVRCEFAPRGPSPRHGSRASHALFDFNRLFARIAHQKSPQALNTRKLLQRK